MSINEVTTPSVSPNNEQEFVVSENINKACGVGYVAYVAITIATVAFCMQSKARYTGTPIVAVVFGGVSLASFKIYKSMNKSIFLPDPQAISTLFKVIKMAAWVILGLLWCLFGSLIKLQFDDYGCRDSIMASFLSLSVLLPLTLLCELCFSIGLKKVEHQEKLQLLEQKA
jgi:hypothetical protein